MQRSHEDFKTTCLAEIDKIRKTSSAYIHLIWSATSKAIATAGGNSCWVTTISCPAAALNPSPCKLLLIKSGPVGMDTHTCKAKKEHPQIEHATFHSVPEYMGTLPTPPPMTNFIGHVRLIGLVRATLHVHVCAVVCNDRTYSSHPVCDQVTSGWRKNAGWLIYTLSL